MSSSSAPKKLAGFEFTKRKHWRDLLVAELADAFVLVLTAARRVLYCGSAISEILGWREHEVVDGDLLELVQPADRASFRRQFDDSMRSDAEFSTFVRLKSKDDVSTSSGSKTSSTSSKGVLFELVGRRLPFVSSDKTTVCIVMAKPYPGRNVEMLNTFLALKIDNERLQQRLARLKAQGSAALSLDTSFPEFSQHPTTTTPSQLADALNPDYGRTRVWDVALPSPSTAGFDNGMNISAQSPSKTSEDNISEELSRKRLKRSQVLEQHVCTTCGCTESPEWRRGPLGPKTLCNACGLRWAKQERTRKLEEETGGSGGEPVS